MTRKPLLTVALAGLGLLLAGDGIAGRQWVRRCTHWAAGKS